MTVTVLSMRDPVPAGAREINTTSRDPVWGRKLSPFFLGPVTLPDGRTARNVENAWQYSKVYPEHVGPNGLPSPAWFDWSAQGFRSVRAHRYPMGKGRRPLFSMAGSETLDYIQARLRLYIPLYATALLATPALAELEALAATQELALRDFDGYRHDQHGYTLADVFHDPQRKAGHGFVIALLLSGWRPGDPLEPSAAPTRDLFS